MPIRLLAAVLFFLVCSQPVLAECYRIATSAGTGATGEIAQITRHVFATAGLCVETVRVPVRRIDMMLAERQVDGWVQAVDGKVLPSDGIFFLARDLGHLEGTLYWSPEDPEPQGGKVSIGTVTGVSWALEEIRNRGGRLFEVNDNKQLLSMVVNRRIRGFLLPEITYRHFLVRFPRLSNYHSRTVIDLSIRVALRADLKPLAAKLEAAIGQTLEERFPDQVWQRYLEELGVPGVKASGSW